LRPSEEIALLVSDFDARRGTLRVAKACVDGRDKDATKNGDDRVIVLCPRAIAVLERQLALRARLEREGRISHAKLFFKANGDPMRNLQYPYVRWRRTLERLRGIRYRKPYMARHSSVSWDLMIGRSALWVARQHGHSIATMLRAYAAWAEGAVEADLDSIRSAMGFGTEPIRWIGTPPIEGRDLALDLALAGAAAGASAGIGLERSGGERGIRTGGPSAGSAIY
jgi:integrase